MEYAPRRKLTQESKLEAVRQVALSEKPKAQLARELGVRVAVSYRRRGSNWLSPLNTLRLGYASCFVRDDKPRRVSAHEVC